jgi:hypothetical protein
LRTNGRVERRRQALVGGRGRAAVLKWLAGRCATLARRTSTSRSLHFGASSSTPPSRAAPGLWTWGAHTHRQRLVTKRSRDAGHRRCSSRSRCRHWQYSPQGQLSRVPLAKARAYTQCSLATSERLGSAFTTHLHLPPLRLCLGYIIVPRASCLVRCRPVRLRGGAQVYSQRR